MRPITMLLSIFLLAGCSLGVDRAASELSGSHAAKMAVREGWTHYEILGPDKSVKGVQTFYINASSTSDEGEEVKHYWRYDLSDICGTITRNCSNQIDMTKLDAPGAFVPNR